MSTYSFKSVVGAFSDPDAGSYPFVGQQGLKQITVSNATERTAHDTASDGAVMVSYIAGDSGSAEIEMQQTSDFHQFLINWANIKYTQANSGNGANFASAAIKVTDLINGAIHTLTGVSPAKIPDKNYTAAGGMVTWRLMAANVVNQ